VAGLAGRDSSADGVMTETIQCRCVDTRGADEEAAGVDVGCRVTARAIAVEAAERDVVAWGRNHRDVDERPDRRTVARQAAGHALVDAGNGVERVVARRRMALATRRRGRNVVRRFERGTGGEGHGVVTLTAVPARRVLRVERRVRSRVPGGGVGARVHAEEIGGLVTGGALHRRDRRVVDLGASPRGEVRGRMAAFAGRGRWADGEVVRRHAGRVHPVVTAGTVAGDALVRER